MSVTESPSQPQTGAQKLPQWAAGLDGHIALVTGAGRGLGRACALALSAVRS